MKNRKTGDTSGNFNAIGNENSKISISNNKGLGEQFTAAVPYIVYESAMARTERHIKRLVVSLMMLYNKT